MSLYILGLWCCLLEDGLLESVVPADFLVEFSSLFVVNRNSFIKICPYDQQLNCYWSFTALHFSFA